jgi:integral membrane sensor domain MASE1
VVVAAAYLVAAKFGLTMALTAEQITLVWPPTGLALAALLLVGADVWPGDWNPMTPAHERALLLQRLARVGRGIMLLHDTQAKTAAMLPELLRELKRRNYRIVHIAPAGAKQAP